MNGLVATGAPASSSREERAVIPSANKNAARLGLLLEMAFQTKVSIPLREHFVIDRAMRIVAGGATFTNRFVFENERAPLRCVALRTGIRIGRQGERSAGSRLPFVRIMTIAAAHPSIANRMSVRQLKSALHFEMAGKADLGIPVRINDRVARPAGLIVQASGAMTAFATNIFCIGTVRHEARVRGGREVLVHFGMALRTRFRPYKFRSRNIRRDDHGPINSDAGDQHPG